MSSAVIVPLLSRCASVIGASDFRGSRLEIMQAVRRKSSAVWTRLQNGNRSRCLVDLTDTDSSSVFDMAETAAQPALQQVGRPLSLIPVGLYVL